MNPIDPNAEWLEADGLGGFASGTVSGIRTRRYHAILLVATTPPTGRFVLVNGFEAWLERPGEALALTSQPYTPDAVHPDGTERISPAAGPPRPARDHRALERHLHAPAGLVPELPLRRGARPGARPRGGPRVAGDLPLGPDAGRGVLDRRGGRARAGRGSRDGSRGRRAPAPAIFHPPRVGGGRVHRPARNRKDDRRRLPV